MVHPETGEQVLDFTIAETHVKKNSVRKVRHPHRQNRDRELKGMPYLHRMREHFAATVTDVMKDVDPTVKFDARSYKDMGIDVAPMRTIDRVLHDRMRDDVIIVQHPEWTRRMPSATRPIEALAPKQTTTTNVLFDRRHEGARPKKRRRESERAAAGTVAQTAAVASQQRGADRKAALKAAGDQLVADANALIANMYDPTLRGQAFADSLRPILDEIFPERGGKHEVDPREQPGADQWRDHTPEPGDRTPKPLSGLPLPAGPQAPLRIRGREGQKPNKTPQVGSYDIGTPVPAVGRPRQDVASERSAATPPNPTPSAPSAAKPTPTARVLEESELASGIDPRHAASAAARQRVQAQEGVDSAGERATHVHASTSAHAPPTPPLEPDEAPLTSNKTEPAESKPNPRKKRRKAILARRSTRNRGRGGC